MIEKIKSIATRLTLVLTLGTVVALAPTANAQLAPAVPSSYQTGQPNFSYNDTNYWAYALTNQQSQAFTPGTTNTYVKTLRQNQGLTLMLAVWQTNSIVSTTTNYTVKFDVSADGNTYTSGTNGRWPITWTVPLAGLGVSTNVFWTNIPATTLSNLRKIQCTGLSTTASNNIYGVLLYSQSTQ